MNIEDLFIQKCFQETIEDLLLGTGRAGIDNVIEQLRIGGFFSAPASVGFHNNFEGGLDQCAQRLLMRTRKNFTAQNRLTS